MRQCVQPTILSPQNTNWEWGAKSCKNGGNGDLCWIRQAELS